MTTDAFVFTKPADMAPHMAIAASTARTAPSSSPPGPPTSACARLERVHSTMVSVGKSVDGVAKARIDLERIRRELGFEP